MPRSKDAPPAFECANVGGGECEPFPLFALVGEPIVPVTFDASGIIGFDEMYRLQLFWKLNSDFAFHLYQEILLAVETARATVLGESDP